MSKGKKILELIVPITIIGGFLGAVQDILAPIGKFGVWAGLVFLCLAIALYFVPEESKIGERIKKMSEHWKMPLIVSLLIISVSVFICTSFSSKNVKQGGKGILVEKMPIFIEVQDKIFSLVKETNEIVKDTNITVKDNNIRIKTTQLGVEETQSDVKVILQNTKATATQTLAELGYSVANSWDFYRAIQETSGSELVEVLNYFKNAKLKLNRQETVYPYLFTSDNERNNALLRMPKYANLIHSLVILDIPTEKLITVFDVFTESEHLKSPMADFYAHESLNPNRNPAGYETLHPQELLGNNMSNLNRSLISYPLHRMKKDSTKRGGYSLLHTAAVLGELELIKQLIKRGHNPNLTSISGYTPLALAIENENLNVADLLLDHNTVDVSMNENVALEISLLKALDGYYPMLETKQPKDNPYLKVAKRIMNKLEKRPEHVIEATESIYRSHIGLVEKLREQYEPGTYYFEEYTQHINLGQNYLNALRTL
ncbi:ankyrin repeat domain-containing protein [Pseudoalteromonas sp.]|uniref:ankyrin repeat domain-containing protein n=1 Tax=Alteromonadales TaxID=135622 RepID=UPI00261B7335|nr:ankyrin repeat domain-containing protein [Pseudoalteromonas sp.]MCP4587313.1 hypothetical protein [Pseudoalteromonas sp.]